MSDHIRTQSTCRVPARDTDQACWSVISVISRFQSCYGFFGRIRAYNLINEHDINGEARLTVRVEFSRDYPHALQGVNSSGTEQPPLIQDWYVIDTREWTINYWAETFTEYLIAITDAAPSQKRVLCALSQFDWRFHAPLLINHPVVNDEGVYFSGSIDLTSHTRAHTVYNGIQHKHRVSSVRQIARWKYSGRDLKENEKVCLSFSSSLLRAKKYLKLKNVENTELTRATW